VFSAVIVLIEPLCLHVFEYTGDSFADSLSMFIRMKKKKIMQLKLSKLARIILRMML
jgi:hypothetical protein